MAKYIAKGISCFELTIAYIFPEQTAEQQAIHAIQADLNFISNFFCLGSLHCIEQVRFDKVKGGHVVRIGLEQLVVELEQLLNQLLKLLKMPFLHQILLLHGRC